MAPLARRKWPRNPLDVGALRFVDLLSTRAYRREIGVSNPHTPTFSAGAVLVSTGQWTGLFL